MGLIANDGDRIGRDQAALQHLLEPGQQAPDPLLRVDPLEDQRQIDSVLDDYSQHVNASYAQAATE